MMILIGAVSRRTMMVVSEIVGLLKLRYNLEAKCFLSNLKLNCEQTY